MRGNENSWYRAMLFSGRISDWYNYPDREMGVVSYDLYGSCSSIFDLKDKPKLQVDTKLDTIVFAHVLDDRVLIQSLYGIRLPKESGYRKEIEDGIYYDLSRDDPRVLANNRVIPIKQIQRAHSLLYEEGIGSKLVNIRYRLSSHQRRTHA